MKYEKDFEYDFLIDWYIGYIFGGFLKIKENKLFLYMCLFVFFIRWNIIRVCYLNKFMLKVLY